jgi:Arc/MetJ family transcription regulator
MRTLDGCYWSGNWTSPRRPGFRRPAYPRRRRGGTSCARPISPGFLPARHPRLIYTREVIFKQVGEGRPYPDHARSAREWAAIPPRPVRLDQLITTKNVLDLHTVLAKDSTFYGDLFPHVIRWKGELYLEDGLHRALRAALHQRSVLHVRVLDLG